MAQALLEKAIAIDPNYGQALGLLGTSYMFTAHMGWMEMAAAMPVAERAARAAIRADGEDAWAHNALGHVHLFARRFEDSLAEFETALRLNPNFALAQGYYGLSLSYSGRWQDADEAAAPRDPPQPARSLLRRSISASPPMPGSSAATIEEAIRLAQESLRQRSDFVGAHRVLTAAAGMAGNARLADTALQELPPRPAQRLAGLDRRVHADQAGRRPRALSRRLSPGGLTLRPEEADFPIESTMVLRSVPELGSTRRDHGCTAPVFSRVRQSSSLRA